MEENKDQVASAIISGSDFLAHHGIKGMRWGVRRTQEQLGHEKVSKNNKNKQKETKTITTDSGRTFEKVGRKLYVETGKIDSPSMKKLVASNAKRISDIGDNMQRNCIQSYGWRVPHYTDLLKNPEAYGAMFARDRGARNVMKLYTKNLDRKLTSAHKSYIKRLEALDDNKLTKKDIKTKNEMINQLNKNQEENSKAFKETLSALDKYDKMFIAP